MSISTDDTAIIPGTTVGSAPAWAQEPTQALVKLSTVYRSGEVEPPTIAHNDSVAMGSPDEIEGLFTHSDPPTTKEEYLRRLEVASTVLLIILACSAVIWLSL